MWHSPYPTCCLLVPGFADGTADMVSCGCFQAFWFYRPTEVPETAWSTLKQAKKHTKGCAAYKLPGKFILRQEDLSERQVRTASRCLHEQRLFGKAGQTVRFTLGSAAACCLGPCQAFCLPL
jgi:hypothetical protein